MVNAARTRIGLAVAIAMLVSTGSPAVGEDEQAPGGTFYDDDLIAHEPSIEAIASSGVTRGCNPPLNNLFCPARAVTRGEMAAFLNRAIDLPAAPPAEFLDIDHSPFESDIARIAAAGITKGCNPPANTLFCPDEPVTREQMAAFLARALHLPNADQDAFADDETSIFSAAIDSLAAAGITKGCNPPTNDRYCPRLPVTRAEMATFLARALLLATSPVPQRPYRIDVVSRTQWGALAPNGDFVPHKINQITIHHSNDEGSNSGPALYRSWQAWHQHLGWPDIAYHYIVGVDGQVYEGRPVHAVGDTATEYDPTGHLLIVVEGSFDEDEPTAEQLEALAQMVAWAQMYFAAPITTGHRDHAATTCPGDHLYAYITSGALSARVDEIIDAGGATLVVGGSS